MNTDNPFEKLQAVAEEASPSTKQDTVYVSPAPKSKLSELADAMEGEKNRLTKAKGNLAHYADELKKATASYIAAKKAFKAAVSDLSPKRGPKKPKTSPTPAAPKA